MKSPAMHKSLLSCVINCENRARRRLIIKYEEPLSFYNVKVINDIIFNEESHFVAMFKEYLIYEESNEFLKRFYSINESSFKIVRILQFFEKYSKIYPNYTKLPESKYIYKNIKRKQKMIDLMQEDSDSDEIPSDSGLTENSNIFTTNAMQSINSTTQSICQNSHVNENDIRLQQLLCIGNEDLDKDNKGKDNKDDSINGIDTILMKIKKAENNKAYRKKDIIGVLRKNINDVNVLSPKMKSKLFDIKTKIFESNGLRQHYKLPVYTKNTLPNPNPNANNTNSNPNGDSLLIRFDKMLLTTNTGNSINKSGLKSDRIINSSFTNRKPMSYTTANSLNKRKQTIKHKTALNNNRDNNYNSNTNTNNNSTSINIGINNRNLITGYNTNTHSNINYNYNSNANSITNCHINNISSNNQSKSKSNTKNSIMNTNGYKNSINNTQIVCNTKSKMFSPRNSIQVSYPHTQNTSLDKKSRSISKNNSIINNVNIINHVQPGSTQINIYNGTDLLKSLRLNINHKASIQYYTNNSKVKNPGKKPHPKFELNLRKIIHKNMIEVESASDRNNANMNCFDKVNINCIDEKRRHSKMNSMALAKNNISENKYNSNNSNANNNNNNTRRLGNSQNKNLTRQNSLIKVKGMANVIPSNANSNSHTTTNNNNSSSHNNSNIYGNTKKTNLKLNQHAIGIGLGLGSGAGSGAGTIHSINNTNLKQLQLKNLYEMNKFLKQKNAPGLLASQIYSERNKKPKINFK